jgi:hypothetical protein
MESLGRIGAGEVNRTGTPLTDKLLLETLSVGENAAAIGRFRSERLLIDKLWLKAIQPLTDKPLFEAQTAHETGLLSSAHSGDRNQSPARVS